MSTATPLPYQHYRFSVADFRRMGQSGILSEQDRVELIEGELVDMSPIGSLHAGTVKYLSNLLKLAIGEYAIVSTQDPIFLNSHSEPLPDIALLKPREDFYRQAHPHPADVLLIVEVADTTLRYDRELKIPLYARHGIPETWLVELDNRLLHVYRRPIESVYQNLQTFDNPQTLTPVMLPECPVDVTRLF